MSDQVTWVEMLDIDPARSFRMRAEEERHRCEIEQLQEQLHHSEWRNRDLETDVRIMEEQNDSLRSEVKRLRRLCVMHHIDVEQLVKSCK